MLRNGDRAWLAGFIAGMERDTGDHGWTGTASEDFRRGFHCGNALAPPRKTSRERLEKQVAAADKLAEWVASLCDIDHRDEPEALTAYNALKARA